jgi:hypothetical protein
VSIAWTGPKVISPDLPLEHMKETRALLRRKPFIWENLYANDGPKNCKFLKLKYFGGRSTSSLEEAEACGLNMLNQPQLSKILFLSSKFVIQGESEDQAFRQALDELCSIEFRDFLLENRRVFLEEGLDSIPAEKKSLLLDHLPHLSDPAAIEVEAWLRGEYIVGSECLTD